MVFAYNSLRRPFDIQFCYSHFLYFHKEYVWQRFVLQIFFLFELILQMIYYAKACFYLNTVFPIDKCKHQVDLKKRQTLEQLGANITAVIFNS